VLAEVEHIELHIHHLRKSTQLVQLIITAMQCQYTLSYMPYTPLVLPETKQREYRESITITV
jgi:hypothetical protein